MGVFRLINSAPNKKIHNSFSRILGLYKILFFGNQKHEFSKLQ